MSISEAEKITVNTYDNIARIRRGMTTNKDFWRDIYLQFVRRLRNPRVLDLGCGDGRDAELHQSITGSLGGYSGLDLSYEMLICAKGRNLVDHKLVREKIVEAEPLVQGDFYKLPFRDNIFNLVWAPASLIHTPRELLREPLAEINRVTDVGGKVFFAMKYGRGEKWEEGKSAEDRRFVVYWGKGNFGEVLNDAGFSIVDAYVDSTRDNRHVPWLCVFADKNLRYKINLENETEKI